MKLFLDTEFNEFKGELISIALVPAYEDDAAFYGSLGCESPGPWVAQNVMPVIGVNPEPRDFLQRRLQTYLAQYPFVTVVADWPEDIAHLCELLIVGPGMAIKTPRMTFELRRDLDTSKSLIPHNALEDAHALRRAYLELE